VQRERGEHADREIVGGSADRVPSGRPTATPMSGISPSKLANSTEVRRRCRLDGPAIPRAVDTAKVSRPSGSTSAMILAAIARKVCRTAVSPRERG
jgi:hypothetical protein